MANFILDPFPSMPNDFLLGVIYKCKVLHIVMKLFSIMN